MILGIIALIFIVVAIIYVADARPSRCPASCPGRIAGSTGHHPLRAVGSFVIGIVFAVGAWFALAYKPQAPGRNAANNKESSPAGGGADRRVPAA